MVQSAAAMAEGRGGVFVKDKLLEVAQVAKMLTISPSTVYRLIESGKLPHVRVGAVNGIRVRKSALDEYLRGCE